MKNTLIYYEILKYQQENIDFLKNTFNVISLPNPDYDSDDILKKANIILCPLGYYCGEDKIKKAVNLKIIGSNTTGHPHIDVEYAEKSGIDVVTLKNEQEFLKSITPTAELTWGLIIALTRNIIPASKSVLNGKWDRRPFGGISMLSQMKIGIAGLGRLGKMVAVYAKSFGMEVEFYDPHVSEHENDIIKVKDLKRLVSKNDIITIHIPHLPETENLFNRSIFSEFKDSSYLINTSRGELIDFESLLDGLITKKIAGAALDVFEGEFEPDFQKKMLNNPLLKYARENENLIFTPHIGGSTFDAWRRTEKHTIDMIMEILDEI